MHAQPWSNYNLPSGFPTIVMMQSWVGGTIVHRGLLWPIAGNFISYLLKHRFTFSLFYDIVLLNKPLCLQKKGCTTSSTTISSSVKNEEYFL
jgi:hypothetical protein